MDLRKLEFFEAVSRHKNFTRAAEELHVTQPSITTAILKLEEKVGVLLLERTQHSVKITCEGELFLERAKHILREAQNLVDEFRELGVKANRTLKLAIPTSLGSWMFPIVFSEYAAKYPDVILKISELGTQRIIESIQNESNELGFIPLSDPSPTYMTLPFSKSQLFIVSSINHPLGRYEKIPFELLKDERFFLAEGSSYIKKKIRSECEKYHFEPNIVFTPLQVATMFNIVASGAGISFVLSNDIAIIKNNPYITMKPLEDPIEFQTGFIWSANKYLSKVSHDFIQFIKNAKGS